jgi:hypothetical protein
MDSVIDELKQRAHYLQRGVRSGDRIALQRMRTLREMKPLPTAAICETVRRRHCLSVLARELGLQGWSHLTQLCTQRDAHDFGALLYPSSCGGHWNIWCADYDEARRIRAEHGGYLLCYGAQLLIVDGHFIADLGLEPEHDDWQRIGRDWARPVDLAARWRLLEAVLRARLAPVDVPGATR